MFIRVYIDGNPVIEKSLYKSVITIGRSSESDIQIKLPEISSDHLNIIVSEDKITLIDKKSLNGSFLNNVRMKGMANYEYTDNLPVHLAKSVALEILASSEEASESNIQAYPDLSKANVTTTEKLGLDFTSIRNLAKFKKDLKHATNRPARREKVSKPDLEDRSYLLHIIIVVVLVAIYLIYFKK